MTFIKIMEEMNIKIFVTAATGYIGFNVARAFRRSGKENGLVDLASFAGPALFGDS